MIFFILTIICSLVSSGSLLETKNVDDLNLMPPDVTKNVGDAWQTVHTIHGNFYGQTQRNVVPKPCSRRSNSESEPMEQLSPSSLSNINKPLLNDKASSLKPQSLRNGDFYKAATDKHELLPNPPYNDDDKLHKPGKSLPISNPVIDSSEVSHHEIILTPNSNEPNSYLSAPSRDFHPSPTSAGRLAGSRSLNDAPVNVARFVPTNEYGAEPDDQYLSGHNEIHSTLTELHSDPSMFVSNNDIPKAINSVQTQSLPSLIVKNELHPEPKKQKVLNKPKEVVADKCSHANEPEALIDDILHSRRSMSSYTDDETAKEIVINNKGLVENTNYPYAEEVDNENALTSILNGEPSTVKPSKDKSKLPEHEKSVSRMSRPQFNEARRDMMEPTRSTGVVNMGQSSLMLLKTERICYACSTATNPTCWAPDRRTTVKYCKKGNNACITKTFGSGSTFTLIRDCGRSCDDSDMGGLMPKYKSCSMCHSELCNGAYSINGHSIIFALLLTALIKYLN